MKRIIVTVVVLAFGGALWWNRYPIFFLLAEVRNRPPDLQFSESAAGAIPVYYVPSPAMSARISQITKSLTDNISAAQKELDVALPRGTKIYLYSNWQEKGGDIQDIRVASVNPKRNSIHCIVNERYDGTRERPEYELLLYAKLGKPARPEWGLCAAAALGGTWNQKTLSQWAAFLMARSLGPQIPAFMTGHPHQFNDEENFSDFLTVPWNALLAKFIKEKFGWNAFADLYRSLKLPSGYEPAWKEYVRGLTPAALPHSPPFKPEFQKGVSYAYWNSYGEGYPAAKSQRSLDELQKIGVRWVAAIPYGFMRSASATQIYFPGPDIGSESDESMFALADDARKRGMKIMMKPQLWMSYDSWPGKIDFTSDTDWQKWFDSYGNWIIHYAIISELMDADLFCIGTELVQTTLKKPQEWKSMIERIRQVYHGPLVYAANYGDEFEGIAFWNSLDYIGLDNYYPVRSSPDQGIAEMKRAFLEQRERIKSIAFRYQKPLIFTEVGYQAMEGAGMGSREGDHSRYSEEMQDTCYRLLLDTYWNENWFYGMYWWKWFSNPDDSGKKADPHSPHDRLAEKTLEEYYRKER